LKDQIFGRIESPIAGGQINQLDTLQGWAFSTTGEKTKITVFFDDELLYETGTGMPTFDIEKKFPNYENAYTSGFRGKLFVAMYDNGLHKLRVEASSGDLKKTLASFTVQLNKDPLLRVNASHDNLLNQGFDVDDYTVRPMIELCNVKKNFKVLEVGCQYGRLTMPFIKFLNDDGSYYGLEILSEAVDSCKTNIAAKYPNFHFIKSNVYNKYYNPDGKIKANQYRFPFDDNSFDLVFLVSVFTHMMPDDVKHYLGEISRILKPKSKCFITYFLLDDDSITWIQSNKSDQKNFKFKNDIYRSVDEENPESLISYDTSWIRKKYNESGLTLMSPIHYGSWAGKGKTDFPQDIILAEKK